MNCLFARLGFASMLAVASLSPAFAHAHLQSADPAVGSTVAPANVTFTVKP